MEGKPFRIFPNIKFKPVNNGRKERNKITLLITGRFPPDTKMQGNYDPFQNIMQLVVSNITRERLNENQ